MKKESIVFANYNKVIHPKNDKIKFWVFSPEEENQANIGTLYG